MSYRKLVIFDFDGTIADSADWLFGVFNDVAQRCNFREISGEERNLLRGRSTREIMDYLGVSAWKLPSVAREFRRVAARDAEKIRLFPWVPDLFRELRGRGAAIAIVSSNAEATIRRVVGTEIASIVHDYAAGTSLFGKPAKIRAAIRRSGLPKSMVASVGDEVRDIEAARIVGIPSLAVTWGYATASALEAARPTQLVHRPAELLDWCGA